jgi:hypothetical protein
MKKCLRVFTGLCVLWPLALHAQQYHLKSLETGMSGPRTQILVLGTVHLDEAPKDFEQAALDGVLQRLANFQPDIITIEAESGEECDLALRHPAVYGSDYCTPPTAAKAATGLDIPAAIAEVRKTLKNWPAPANSASPAQRRHLAALFLAAKDSASAYVQWLQLPEAERHAGDGLDSALVQMLTGIATINNENYRIAARLAARLGLQRVYAVDNHTGDNLDIADTKRFVRELEAAWKADSAALEARDKREDLMLRASDLLPLYRAVNDPQELQLRADVNVGATMRAQSASGSPQIWVGGWETRNLRMVANIRESFREHPGARVLVIVGATHKPWLDEWLGQLQGVDIVDTLSWLK